MITLKDIQSIYKQPIPTKMKNWINKYIENPQVQTYIHKALQYKLTNNDYKELYKIGNHKGIYPGLHYLCRIYIHELTKAQYLLYKLDNLEKSFRKD